MTIVPRLILKTRGKMGQYDSADFQSSVIQVTTVFKRFPVALFSKVEPGAIVALPSHYFSRIVIQNKVIANANVVKPLILCIAYAFVRHMVQIKGNPLILPKMSADLQREPRQDAIAVSTITVFVLATSFAFL